MDAPPLGGLGAARQQGEADTGRGEVFRDIGKVLPRKNFGRGHDAGLAAVADSDQGRQDGDHGLAGADVALEEAVHLASAHQVGANLLDDPFLGACQRIGEGVVAAVESLSDLGHRDAFVRAAADVFLLEEGQLEEEELLEFQAEGGFAQGVGIGREMDVLQRVGEADEVHFRQDIVRKGFPYFRQAELQGIGHQLVHDFPRDSAALEPVGGGVYAGHDARAGGGIAGAARVARLVDFRMDHVDAAPVHRGLPEKEKGPARLQAVGRVLDPLEKDQFHAARTVFHPDAQPLSPDLAGDDSRLDLDEGRIRHHRGDRHHRAPVDVTERV